VKVLLTMPGPGKGTPHTLHELLAIFEEDGVDGALWFTFAGYQLPHRADPRRDLGLASYGVVRMAEDGVSWEPKEVFHALAEAYAR
jgi:hypothetical protein